MKRCGGAVRAAAFASFVVAALGTACGGSAPPAATLQCDRAVSTDWRREGPVSLPLLPQSTATPDLPAAQQTALDRWHGDVLDRTGAPAMTAAWSHALRGRWSRTDGLARTAPAERVGVTTAFDWASVGKSVTAVLVLQLVDEGQLALTDPVARWFPEQPFATLVTVEHLLTHTSGWSTNAQGGPQPGSGEPPVSALERAAATPAVACPGARFNYSNTGYLVLGLIAEQVTGLAYPDLVQQRIAGPLGLRSFRAVAPGAPPDGVATAHRGRVPQPDPGLAERRGMGSIVARADDMLVYWEAVMTGRFLRPATARGQWSTLGALAERPDLAFGQGVMEFRWTDETGRERLWWGHAGGTQGANALVVYDPLLGVHAAVAVNNEVPAAAVVRSLLDAAEAPFAVRAALAEGDGLHPP